MKTILLSLLFTAAALANTPISGCFYNIGSGNDSYYYLTGDVTLTSSTGTPCIGISSPTQGMTLDCGGYNFQSSTTNPGTGDLITVYGNPGGYNIFLLNCKFAAPNSTLSMTPFLVYCRYTQACVSAYNTYTNAGLSYDHCYVCNSYSDTFTGDINANHITISVLGSYSDYMHVYYGTFSTYENGDPINISSSEYPSVDHNNIDTTSATGFHTPNGIAINGGSHAYVASNVIVQSLSSDDGIVLSGTSYAEVAYNDMTNWSDVAIEFAGGATDHPYVHDNVGHNAHSGALIAGYSAYVTSLDNGTFSNNHNTLTSTGEQANLFWFSVSSSFQNNTFSYNTETPADSTCYFGVPTYGYSGFFNPSAFGTPTPTISNNQFDHNKFGSCIDFESAFIGSGKVVDNGGNYCDQAHSLPSGSSFPLACSWPQ